MKKYLTYGIITLSIVVVAIVLSGYFKSGNAIKNPLPALVVIPNEDSVIPVNEKPPEDSKLHYIEIIDGCNWMRVGTCINMRSGPGTDYPVVLQLRIGMVFQVEADTVHGGDYDWYKVIFDKELRYPERVTSDWYIAVNKQAVRPFKDVGEIWLPQKTEVTTNKRIVVDLSKETLSAYDGDTLFMEEDISAGMEGTHTPVGKFTIYRKIPSRYMQGPIPGVSDGYYDLPAIPWDLYFTNDGDVLHGAYWHNNFGKEMSHGCVNQSPENAKKLYEWADLGTSVTVQN